MMEGYADDGTFCKSAVKRENEKRLNLWSWLFFSYKSSTKIIVLSHMSGQEVLLAKANIFFVKYV